MRLGNEKHHRKDNGSTQFEQNRPYIVNFLFWINQRIVLSKSMHFPEIRIGNDI